MMRWMLALVLVGMLFLAGCPEEQQVPVEGPEPEPVEKAPPPPPPPEPEPEIITIGYIGPLSGDHFVDGNEALNALRIAASELSDDNYVYEIAEQDGFCTSEGAATALNSLLDFRGVNVVIGGVCPEEVDGMAPLLEQKGVVLISLSTGAVDNDYVMNFAGSPQALGTILADFCKEKKMLRTMVVTDGTAAALERKNLFDAAAKKAGLSTQPAQTYSEKTFGSTVSVIKSYQPEVVLVFASGGQEATAVVKKLREGGVNSKIIGDENMVSSAAISFLGKDSEGIYAILPEFDANDPAASYFMNSYISQYGAPSSAVRVADARNALYLLAQAEEFYYYAPTAQDIQQYWTNLGSWAGMGATLQFEHGDRAAAFRIVQVQGGNLVDQ
jgi:branched-chain amino acid transport system substrate-binding protein